MIQLPAEKILLDQSYQNWKEALTEIGQWMTQQGESNRHISNQ